MTIKRSLRRCLLSTVGLALVAGFSSLPAFADSGRYYHGPGQQGLIDVGVDIGNVIHGRVILGNNNSYNRDDRGYDRDDRHYNGDDRHYDRDDRNYDRDDRWRRDRDDRRSNRDDRGRYDRR